MTTDFLAVTTIAFHQFWRFFNSWTIPCTNVTPAAFFLFCGFVHLFLRFITNIINGSTSPSSSSVRSSIAKFSKGNK